MSELRIETWTMQAADLGPENPLPSLRGGGGLHASKKKASMPTELLESIAWGHPANSLPYTVQDGYSRIRQPRDLSVAILENEFLRAAFLLEHGGRLWSLVHKPSGRELLYLNPVFQPANLAIRNAWFSGGVEWNIGIIGHSPFTCDPLFAARIEGPDGTPILRLYEWERIRQVPFQIDAYLPDGLPVLLVRVSITNPHERAIPMYWWSNIAVPETADTRVLVPAEEAHCFNYRGLDLVPVPVAGGIDHSYATNLPYAADYFYRIPDARRPWIAALDGQGKGLVHASTDRLRGRKLFVWGTGSGGRRWQEFLSVPGQAYIEIQAGLARTQMEYLAMPARTGWAWLEAYGLLEANADAVHGAGWLQAQQAAEDALDRLIPPAYMDAELSRSTGWADRPPSEMIQTGSGWGALERRRREMAGEPSFCSPGLPFDDSALGEPQTAWLALLHTGTMPAEDPEAAPGGYLVQAEWRTMLEAAVQARCRDNWLAWLHLGIMRYCVGDRDGARRAWEHSLSLDQSPWALANLAAVAQDEERLDDAADLYLAAQRMQPGLLPLAVACGRTLIEAGRASEWLELIPHLPAPLRSSGRIRLLEAQAALAIEALDIVDQIFAEKPVVDDIREGETSLSHLWQAYQERRLSLAEGRPVDDELRARARREFPVPGELDYRMIVEQGS